MKLALIKPNQIMKKSIRIFKLLSIALLLVSFTSCEELDELLGLDEDIETESDYYENTDSTPSCGAEDYNGPDFNIQIDSYCKAAYAYDCAGQTSERDVYCDLYYEVASDFGYANPPTCNYCN